MWSYFFKTLGVIGLLCITKGVFIRKEASRDWAFTIGGIFLLAYSIYLHDVVFILLQLVFIFSNLYREYFIKQHGQHISQKK